MLISINCRRRSIGGGVVEGGRDSLVGRSCSYSLKGWDNLKDGDWSSFEGWGCMECCWGCMGYCNSRECCDSRECFD